MRRDGVSGDQRRRAKPELDNVTRSPNGERRARNYFSSGRSKKSRIKKNFWNANGRFNRKVQRRPEGLTINSHAREGVGKGDERCVPGPKDRHLGVNSLTHLRRFCLLAVGVHALTGVAINCQPFGPV